MALGDLIKRHVPFIEEKLGNQTFTWEDETFPCHVGSLLMERELDAGGFSEKVDLLLIVRRNAFGDGVLPSKGNKLTFRSTQYKVDSIRIDTSNELVRLRLVSVNKGA